MRHTKHADFALRVLMYLRVAPGRRGSIADMAAAHRISRNHLDKVVRRMSEAGLVATLRGRGGGVHWTRCRSRVMCLAERAWMWDECAVAVCLGPACYC